jgi:hypothetical protein
MRVQILLAFMLLIVSACQPIQPAASATGTVSQEMPVTSPAQEEPSQTPMNNPYAPLPGDSNLTQGNVFVQEMGVMIRESYPPQISLMLSGDLPTPCHELRLLVNEPDEEKKINVDAYTVVDPNMMCTQVLKPFQANVDLGTFPSGHYSVWVNGELAGEFDS